MNPQEDISIDSLLASEKFQNYCLAPEPDDHVYWQAWQSKSPEHQANFEEAQKWVQAIAVQLEEEEIQAELKTLKNSLATQVIPIKRASNFKRHLWKLAAAVAILLFAWGIYGEKDTVDLHQISTDFGQTQKIVLVDGSEVTLNANSSIQFSKYWKKQPLREVWMKGEGYFDIAHDPKHAFILHLDKGDIEVLGTSFNASQRGEKLKVTLVSGQVKLSLADQPSIMMKPGEQVQVDESGISHEKIDIEPVTAWKDNRMIYRNASIASIIERLKTDFDWKVEVLDEDILEKRVNAVIQQNDPEGLLNALAEIYELNIEKVGEGNYLIK